MILRRNSAGAALIWAAFCAPGLADVAAITSQNADLLTLLDTDRLATIAELPLPGKPAAVAVDGPRSRVLAVAVDSGRLHVFDLTGRKLAEWPLAGAPFAVVIRPDTGTALITDITGFLREIDPATGRELQNWQVGTMPSGVAVGVDLIAIANRDDNDISLISPTGSRRIAVGEHPFGVTLHEGRIFVTNVLSDSVSVIDPALDQIVATIPTGERPYAIAFSAGKGFVTNQYSASITVFDADTYEMLTEIETDEYPEGIATSADGHIFVANWFSDSLQVIDPTRLEVTQTLPMPAGPRAFGSFIGQPAQGAGFSALP
ncbi:YncE family protein [Paracoccus caeni]|uniref:YncE family protein n=1 Tax=Paracoccus caeni TaxID=657651 RepID=A0A934SPS5_9RHOB|nr:YncE family protein [Paracoccus caeni]MBK4218203.1 YncE family protein [Paracoccus caeni]